MMKRLHQSRYIAEETECPRNKMPCLNRLTSSPEMTEKKPSLFLQRVEFPAPVKVTDAQHLYWVPMKETWRSRDAAINFTQCSFEPPILKVIKMEPTGRKSMIVYEKDLVKIEEHLLKTGDGDKL